MITDTQKDEIFNEMVFKKGLFYLDKKHEPTIKQMYQHLNSDFNTKEDLERAVKSILHRNGLNFFNEARFLDEVKFIQFIQRQFNRYNNHTPNNAIKWLKFTEKIIMGGIGFLKFNEKANNAQDLQDAFLEWYDSKIRELQPLQINDNDKSKETNNKTSFTFINNFDQIESNTIYKYFFDSLVKTKYLNESTLQKYLITAFQDMQKPQQRITIRNKPTNKKIQEVFYNYYKDIAGKPYGKQQNYVELLGDYFIGFDTEKLKTNFSKTY